MSDRMILCGNLQAQYLAHADEINAAVCRVMNSRLDEIQAAILRVKLRYLDGANRRRNEIASYYDAQLGKKMICPMRREKAQISGHVFHLYVVRVAQRVAMIERMKERGVAAMVHYPVPIHQQPAYAGRIAIAGGMAHTERAAAEVLSLPMYPELTWDDLSRVVDAARTPW